MMPEFSGSSVEPPHSNPEPVPPSAGFPPAEVGGDGMPLVASREVGAKSVVVEVGCLFCFFMSLLIW